MLGCLGIDEFMAACGFPAPPNASGRRTPPVPVGPYHANPDDVDYGSLGVHMRDDSIDNDEGIGNYMAPPTVNVVVYGRKKPLPPRESEPAAAAAAEPQAAPRLEEVKQGGWLSRTVSKFTRKASSKKAVEASEAEAAARAEAEERARLAEEAAAREAARAKDLERRLRNMEARVAAHEAVAALPHAIYA